MRKSIIFAIGFAAGLILSAAFFMAYSVSEGTKDWGKPEVYFDDEAIEFIDDYIKISKQINTPYFYVDGFQDHTVYISFSGDKSYLENLVHKITGKNIANLSSWRYEDQSDDFRFGPGEYYSKLYLTPLYNLKMVTDGLFYEEKASGNGWYLIYDPKGLRVYYCKWNI